MNIKIGTRVRLPQRLGRCQYATVTRIDKQGRAWVYWVECSYTTGGRTYERRTYYRAAELEAAQKGR